ncbi:MAG: ribonuclease P protein component [Nitriliruptor sp.]|nr:MAG: ribonuclease P protein component [Nitriliruptor sp.]
MTFVDGGHGRLRRGVDISAVLRGRWQRAGRSMIVHAAERADGDGDRARVAVIASRRVGGAVQRNRAKRRLRELVRHLPLRREVDLVLVARRRCVDAPFAELGAELEELCTALGVLDTSVSAEVGG